MPDKTTQAEEILNNVFDETQKVINMNITSMGEIGIASVLTGLTAFFIAGFKNDYDLCQELTPVFQKRIMPAVSKQEYEDYTYVLNDSYIKFREAAISYQYKSDDWVSKMMSEFSEMLLVMLRANATDYSRGLMDKEVQRLLDIVRKINTASAAKKDFVETKGSKTVHDNDDAGNRKRKIKRVAISVAVALVCIIYYYCTSVHTIYTPRKSLYFMQERYEDNSGYMDCFIEIAPGEEDSKKSNFGTIKIYIFDYANSSEDEWPRNMYMTYARCGYWEWKKLIGSLATNNRGKKFDIIPKGYTRVDCFMSEGTAVGFDEAMDPIEGEDNTIPEAYEILDFGTNNFVYEGTVYSEVNPDQLDSKSDLLISVMELRMSEVLGE